MALPASHDPLELFPVAPSPLPKERAPGEGPQTDARRLGARPSAISPASRAIAALSVAALLNGFSLMVFELVGARLIARFVGSSLDTWTTVIGTILAGISVGNRLGGYYARRLHARGAVPALFIASGVACAATPALNALVGNALLDVGWPYRVRLAVLAGVTFLPASVLLGTIAPLLACRALSYHTRTGRALGSMYAWGTLGSILGTFATGFFLLAHAGSQAIFWTCGGVLAATGGFVFLVDRNIAFLREVGRGTASEPAVRAAVWSRAWPSALVFTSGACLMAMEMAGSRFVSENLGTSIYTWTTLIGVVLAGSTIGNAVGGVLADRFRPERALPHLFCLASVAMFVVVRTHQVAFEFVAESLQHVSSPLQIVASVAAIFLPPCIALGTVAPVAARLALRRTEAAGDAIGSVHAWGALGSIAGTFLSGYVLIAAIGTHALIAGLAAILGLMAVMLPGRSYLHALWGGLAATLAIVLVMPPHGGHDLAARAGLRSEVTSAYRRESNYYTIQVSDVPWMGPSVRALALDSLLHGFVDPTHPETLRYEYEEIYASVMERARAMPAMTRSDPAPLNTLYVGGGSYTFPRYVASGYPGSAMLVMEIDPAVTRAAHEALFLPKDTPIVTRWGDARVTVDQLLAEQQRDGSVKPFDFVFGDAFNDFSVPWHLTTREFNQKVDRLLAPDGVYMINIIDDIQYGEFLGAYVKTARETFPGVAVFVTDDPPSAKHVDPAPGRKTFVIAMSKRPVDWTDLGRRPGERPFHFFQLSDRQLSRVVTTAETHVLTDDFAPIENMLAKVARDR